MKLLKKTFALMLSLILVVGMIPGTMTAYAAGTSGGGITLSGDRSDWNIKISDEGVLSWDAQAGATKYELEFYEGVADAYPEVFIGDLTTNSCDLKAAFEAKKIEHNEFYLSIKALKGTTGVGSTVSTSGTPDIRVQYMSSLPKMSEPQKLKHDATGQSWDSVPGATGYIFNLYDADGNNKARNIETDKTALNFYKEDGYWFTVQATAPNYRNSNAAESPKYGEVVTPTYTVTFNSLGGTTIAPQTVKHGEKAVKPADPEAAVDSLVFDKWIELYSDAEYNFDTPVTKDITLVAQYKQAEGGETPPTEYNITVTGGTTSANKAVAGTVITLTAEQIDGKVFSHWEVNGATVSDANAKETTFTMGNADVTAEAIYDDCECKCHKGGIVGFFYKIVLFFQKLFGNNLVCNCGKKH